MTADLPSFLSSGNTDFENAHDTLKTLGRSRFSKALPAPPPALEKRIPLPSSTRHSAPAEPLDTMHSLPPLPPVQPSLPILPPQPPPPPSKTTLPVLPLSALPQAVPSGAIRRRPVASSVSATGSNSDESGLGSKTKPPHVPAAATSATVLPTVSSLPRLPDLPSFNSFSSLGDLPEKDAASPSAPTVLPELPEILSVAQDTNGSLTSETTSQTSTHRPSFSPSPTEDPHTSRAASISSILSAYSEMSAVPLGLSSSNSEATVSTNASSAGVFTSPLRPLLGDKSQQAFDEYQRSFGLKLDEDTHTPLSYLLDGDYADEDEIEVNEKENADEEAVVTNVASQNNSNNSDEYDPFSDACYSYKTPKIRDTTVTTVYRVEHQTTNGLNNASAPPDSISKTEAAALPPRSTSLRDPPPDFVSKTITLSTDSRKYDDSLPSLPQHSSSPVVIWENTSNKTETNLSAANLHLQSPPASPNPFPVAVTADARLDDLSRAQHQLIENRQKTQPQKQDLPPVTPAKDVTYLAYGQPLPPPQSPLPLPPSRSGLGQVKNPLPLLTTADKIAVAPSLLVPPPRSDSQAGLALTATAFPPNVSQPPFNMGASLTKIESKLKPTFKRKNLPNSAPGLPQLTKLPHTLTEQVSHTLNLQPPPSSSFQRPPTPSDGGEDPVYSKDGRTHHPRDGASVSPSIVGADGTFHSPATVVNAPLTPAASPRTLPACSTLLTTTTQPSERVFTSNTPESAASFAQQKQQLPSPPNGGLLDNREIRHSKDGVQQNRQNVSLTSVWSPVSVQPQPRPQFAPRTSSRNVSSSTVLGVLPGSVLSSKQVPATAPEHQHGDSVMSVISETGSQVTIKAAADRRQPTADDAAKQASLTSEDPPMAPGMPPYFPTGYLTDLVTPNTVFAAPPPSKIQFDCLQQHNDMFCDRNINYSLSCQACQTFERTERWRCKWCYLRICSSCRDSLHTHAQHSLARLIKYIEDGGGKQVTVDDVYEKDGHLAAAPSNLFASDLVAIPEN
ncbi:hypothetical protein SEPCBS57363_001010 [Sporothrix epigloea]|uniref:Uncharacterized protein n=1 Tax=Sporothrix epigloea TaxID=1892477 RepID=A0ABP0D7W0_9PEZI